MATHPVQFTMTAKCSGLDSTDKDIGLRIDAGVYKKLVDNARVDGKLIAVEKADTGSTPKLCTVEYMGVLRFAIDVSLTDTDLNKGIKGAANGAIKLVSYSSTFDPNLVGRVVDYSNVSGNKWVDVLMPAQ